MKISRIIGILSIISGGIAYADQNRTEESFDKGWLFARYGVQADGSRLKEPGKGSGWEIEVTASSEENAGADRTHLAVNAFDGNENTRWCASDGKAEQWLVVDFGKVQSLSELQILWDVTSGWKEKHLPYGYVVEASEDGKKWKGLVDQSGKMEGQTSKHELKASAKMLRIKTQRVEGSQWASIRELRLKDREGKVVENRVKPAGDAPYAVGFADSAWRKVDVPHDWGIEGPFRMELSGNTGKLPWRGIGWYRKHFTVSADDKGQQVYVDFDGAMAHAMIYCNGEYVGTWPYGYSSFRMDLTKFVKFGESNVIAVRLDTEKWDSRWYPGAGIYRHVRLVKTNPVHVAHWGTYITTPTVSPEKGVAEVEVTVDNKSAQAAEVTVVTEVSELNTTGLKPNRSPEAVTEKVQIAAGGSIKLKQQITVQNPKLWSIEQTNRYIARTTVKANNEVLDVYNTPFGFRTIQATARQGFLLNGKRLDLKGVCNHHDLGALGAAMNKRALQRQLEILKEMGCNAIRTSHNPPAPELLDLCDEMGFVVLDEAFDCWAKGKKPNDYCKLYAEWHEKDLIALVRRDCNHPSVVMWSIGNEVMEQQDGAMTKHLVEIVHKADPTRPVTNGYNNPNGGRSSRASEALDVMGVNYFFQQQSKWDNDPVFKDMPHMGSETSSCVSSRGEYFFGKNKDNWQVSSYDVEYPGWGCTPDKQFQINAQYPHLLGEFVWTGFDYLGEPTPYLSDDNTLLLNFRADPAKRAELEKELEALSKKASPSRSSYFGIIDLAGFPKDRYYSYQAHWRPELPMVHIFPHWNWPDRVGQVTPVHVYTSGDEAELFLNGKSQGRKAKVPGKDFRLVWDQVKYEAGELKVVAYKGGKEWASQVVKTTGKAQGLTMAADRVTISAEDNDLSFITVRVVDKDGLMVPKSNPLIKFEVEGPGEIVAVDNGDATSFESFQASQRKAYNGMALVVVKAKGGQAGKFVVKAVSHGLTAAKVEVTAQ